MQHIREKVYTMEQTHLSLKQKCVISRPVHVAYNQAHHCAVDMKRKSLFSAASSRDAYPPLPGA